MRLPLRTADRLGSFIEPADPMAPLARSYLDALLGGDRTRATGLVLDAVDDGAPIRDVYLRVLAPAQREVGRLWELGEIGIAEEHLATAVTQLVISRLSPLTFRTERRDRRMIAVCAGEELHEVGLRMVADFFELDGWDTDYVGGFVPPASIASMVRSRSPDLVAISVTMRSHVDAACEIIRAVRSPEAVERPKILVGGHAFNSEPGLWREIGADGFGRDAEEAVGMADRIVGHARLQ